MFELFQAVSCVHPDLKYKAGVFSVNWLSRSPVNDPAVSVDVRI